MVGATDNDIKILVETSNSSKIAQQTDECVALAMQAIQNVK